MSTSNIFGWAAAGVSTLILVMPLACSSAQGDARQEVNTTWYTGFTLPEFLAEPNSARSKEDIRHMLSAPWYGEILVTKANAPGESIALSSCAQYLANPAGSLSTLREKDGTPFMALALMCRAAQEIVASQPARHSNIPPQFIDENLPRLLPPQVAMVVSEAEWKRQLADPENRSWADINRIRQSRPLSPDLTMYAHEQGSQEIALVARGDFNGDGMEDVLFTSRDQAEGGSYSAVRLFQVTRSAPEGRYELVREYRY